MHRIRRLAVAVVVLLFGCVGVDPDLHSESERPSESEAVGGESEIGSKMHRYLSAMEALGFSGAIIVAHEGEVVLREGYGFADRDARRPYTPSTVQTHGSITKQMTGAAILLLEGREALSVDDPIHLYFDRLPEDKRAITIHQLLTHSSGLPGGVGPDDEPIQARAYVERVMGTSLQFEPGTGYAYSNPGYALLGRIVERVSGMGYEAFLRNELLLPGGLAETGYILPEWDRDRMALGYLDGELWGAVHGRGWLDDGPNWHLRANGGLHTTVDDMNRWLNTVRGRGVLDAEATRRWTTGYVTEGPSDSEYAYGWEVRDTQWGPMIAHNGSNRVFSADFVWLPEPDVFFYIQGNTSMIAAERQRGPLLAAAFDPGFVMPPLVEPDPEARPADAREREGDYHLDGALMELTADDTRLVARVSGQSALDLMLSPAEEQRQHLATLTERTMDAMERLKAGHVDALAGMVDEDQDPVPPTRLLLDRISQIGNLQSLNLVGSFENRPGSPLAELGPWTTFVHARFENWNQYWNMVWNRDGTYRGTFSGPWPSFVLVPTTEGGYTGVRDGPPWDTIELRFEDGCLVVAARRACPED
jgi:CubicO group peptidase (beta-lactamase class C family)